MKASARKRLMAMGLIEKAPDHFSRLTRRGLTTLRAAQGIDARSGQTEGLDPKGESPVAEGHAP